MTTYQAPGPISTLSTYNQHLTPSHWPKMTTYQAPRPISTLSTHNHHLTPKASRHVNCLSVSIRSKQVSLCYCLSAANTLSFCYCLSTAGALSVCYCLFAAFPISICYCPSAYCEHMRLLVFVLMNSRPLLSAVLLWTVIRDRRLALQSNPIQSIHTNGRFCQKKKDFLPVRNSAWKKILRL